MKVRLLKFKTYWVKAKKDGEKDELFIEGFANRAKIGEEKVIDRGLENIPGEEWDIKEWMKNPVILFNHDRDLPIGKGVDAKITDQGLWIKAKISQSDAPDIAKARDLIKEEIIRTFSVGIDVEDEELSEDKSITLKGVSLLETSAVTIPMNQESFFSIAQKDLKEKPYDMLAAEILQSAGSFTASLVHKAMYTKSLKEEGFDRSKILEQKGAKEVLSGEVIPSEEMIEFLQSSLDIPAEELKTAIEEENKLKEEEEEKPDDKPEEEEEGVGKQGDATVPLGTEDQLTTDLGQPGLQALQQLTVLMGQLIAETQKTQKLLEGLGQMPPQGEDDDDEDENAMLGDGEEEDEEEMLTEDEDDDENEELAEGSDDEEEDEEEKQISLSLDRIDTYKGDLEVKLARFAL